MERAILEESYAHKDITANRQRTFSFFFGFSLVTISQTRCELRRRISNLINETDFQNAVVKFDLQVRLLNKQEKQLIELQQERR